MKTEQRIQQNNSTPLSVRTNNNCICACVYKHACKYYVFEYDFPIRTMLQPSEYPNYSDIRFSTIAIGNLSHSRTIMSMSFVTLKLCSYHNLMVFIILVYMHIYLEITLMNNNHLQTYFIQSLTRYIMV